LGSNPTGTATKSPRLIRGVSDPLFRTPDRKLLATIQQRRTDGAPVVLSEFLGVAGTVIPAMAMARCDPAGPQRTRQVRRLRSSHQPRSRDRRPVHKSARRLIDSSVRKRRLPRQPQCSFGNPPMVAARSGGANVSNQDAVGPGVRMSDSDLIEVPRRSEIWSSVPSEYKILLLSIPRPHASNV
jgi:hypothetical protein